MDTNPRPPCIDGYVPENISEARNDEGNMYYNDKPFKCIEIPLEGKFIEEAIGEAYLQWETRSPVFIDAPTGSGKSTFVCEKLIRDAVKSGHNLLLVSNRAALVRQQKLKVAKVVSEYYPDVRSSPKDDEIDDYKIWGNVCICTYHSLLSLLNLAKRNTFLQAFLKDLKYAVFDELHFLYSDATYASSCGELLERIPAAFARQIRVYLTATSWSVLNSIMKSEQNKYYTRKKYYSDQISDNDFLELSWALHSERKLFHYCMGKDYSRYNLHFFTGNDANTQKSLGEGEEASGNEKKTKCSKEVNALLKLFPKPSSENKLLVFVMKRDDGRALEKAWRRTGVKAVFIDRNSKFAPEIEETQDNAEQLDDTAEEKSYKNNVWKKLLRDERYDEDVLIATSVLDCGINIHDNAVKTIVCFAHEPTTFIQMIGRKRMLPETAETVDVWVNVPNKSWYSRLVKDKSVELELAEKLDFIRFFQHNEYEFIDGKMTQCFSKINGVCETAAPDNICRISITHHVELLSRRYTTVYDENYHNFFRTFWNNSGKVKDQKLFRFDLVGQPYVDHYVKWVVQEQRRYYEDMEKAGDFRFIVAQWMGKKELIEEHIRKKQELQSLLDYHCQCPIPPSDRDKVRSLIREIAPLNLTEQSKTVSQDGSTSDSPSTRSKTVNWESATPKTLTGILNSLGFPYEIVRESKSKDWLVFRKQTESEVENVEAEAAEHECGYC